jgi:flagellar hook protein FlgE
MLRSMLSAASAIRNHQIYMDVVANNISNVNTTAYKSGRATFHELLSQVLNPGAAPQANLGGVNPVQIGLGMTLGGVDSIFGQGALQATGRVNDLAIQGGGFFVLQGATQPLYTRDGALDLGLDGSLLNPTTGLRVLGWNANANGVIDTTGALAPIIIPLNQGLIAQATRNVQLGGNLDARVAAGAVSDIVAVAGTVDDFGTDFVATGQTELAEGDYYVEVDTAAGNFRLVDSAGNPVQIASSTGPDHWLALPAPGTTFDTERGLTIEFGAGPFVDGTFAAGTAASVHYDPQNVTTNIQIYDSLGALHSITLTFNKIGVNTWTWQASENDAGITALTPATPTTITFTSAGQYAATNPAATIGLTFSNGAMAQTINLDLSQLSQLADESELSAAVQDGYAPGQLIGFSVSGNGDVTGTYANGMRKVVAKVAVATFVNPGGLLRVGDNMFAPSSNSGGATVGEAGSGGRGTIQAGYLEMANVDLAQQFTSMIMAQRGFQANSRVITASDQMLQDLVNLVR